ncbi:MAG: VWA domain-containing protein [Acidobacteria bacterium]|nr:VWA domain-containing protein [Acidobacteriota bacterium]
MSFAHAWLLPLAWLPIGWAAWEWRGSGRRSGLLLKAGTMLAVLLALAEPVLTVFESKVALAILADTSASVGAGDLARESELATAIEGASGRHWTRVIPFARVARNVAPEERGKTWKLRQTAGESGRGTNLESAVREAAGSLPAGLVPRIALITDGHENMGSVVRAAWQARQAGIPIDTFPLGGRPKPKLRVESVALPSRVFAGERFPIDVALTSPSRATAAVEITAEGRPLGSSRLEIEPGLNNFRVYASVTAAGAVDLAGRIAAGGLGEARFEQAVTLRRPRVLFISQETPESEKHMVQTFQANQFEVERAPVGVTEDLSGYQLVVYNNWDLESIPAGRKLEMEEWVKQGGGLLWIGGERNVYLEKKGPEDPLERLLPAKLAPPRTPEGTCVILIVDKSSSMEGKKMELARLASIGVIENLRPIDLVGVLIFDNSFQWTVPIRRAQDRSLIKRLVAGITPDGGTQIAPALAEAYRRILPINAVYKHIVLLTDGISEEGDSISLSREASQNKVTISTVGLGQDVNRAYLEKVASFSKGKAYFLNEPAGLEQILLRDVMEHTGSTAVEKNVKAAVAKQAEILAGVGVETAPPLRGYVKFISKPTADTILAIEGSSPSSIAPRDPLLARWQYGLGRVAVFTSDAKSRWAAEWMQWSGFDKLWTNLVRDLLPHAEAADASAEYDSANDELVVEYRLARGVGEPAAVPDVYVFGPNEFQKPVKVTKLGVGSYRARVAIGGRQGLFRVRPLAESRAFPEIGFYRQEAEMSDYGSNEFLLRQISTATGGRFNPKPGDAFDAAGRSVPATMELWPGLLALAVVLNIAELILRKGRGLLEAVRGTAVG